MPRKQPHPEHHLIPDVLCPKCHQASVTYNGNYFCIACPWALPESRSQKLAEWGVDAYTKLMKQRGQEPQEYALDPEYWKEPR